MAEVRGHQGQIFNTRLDPRKKNDYEPLPSHIIYIDKIINWWVLIHWSSSACTGHREGAESLGTEEKKRGTAGFAPLRDGLKKGRASTGKKGCLDRSKLLWRRGFGEVIPHLVYVGKTIWNNSTGQERDL